MRILAFDTGQKNNAWALLADGEPILCGMVTPEDADGYGAMEYALYYAFSQLITEHKPDVIAVERVVEGLRTRNVHGAIEASAIMRVAAGKAKLGVMMYSAMTVKAAVGSGRLTKPLMRILIKEKFPVVWGPVNEHTCDAIAVGYTCREDKT